MLRVAMKKVSWKSIEMLGIIDILKDKDVDGSIITLQGVKELNSIEERKSEADEQMIIAQRVEKFFTDILSSYSYVLSKYQKETMINGIFKLQSIYILVKTRKASYQREYWRGYETKARLTEQSTPGY